jgi:glyoxylase-like metal-dependent hydrolase (beta-lactamase superfamily II)
MIFEHLTVGPLQCNCFILGDEATRDAIVVDPGEEADRILALVARHRLTVRTIVQTHAHFDHVGATGPLRDATGAEVCLHRGDTFLYENLAMQAKMFGVPVPKAAPVSRWYGHGEEVKAGGLAMGVLHTPGHTPGSVCLLMAAEQLLFSGDTLFCGSIGRTDLWGGSYEQIMTSIKERLLTLPDDTVVYPGHGPETTIGDERRSNPFVQQLF